MNQKFQICGQNIINMLNIKQKLRKKKLSSALYKKIDKLLKEQILNSDLEAELVKWNNY